jgi:LmbE family N-acetylglucosaminyl deacetylase
MDPNWPLTDDQEFSDGLFSTVKKIIVTTRAKVILAPWPYGAIQHIDHRLVHAAAIRVVDDMGLELLYLDDQPYSRRPLETMIDERGHRYNPFVVNLNKSQMRNKYRGMNLYESQMIPSYMEAVRKPPPGACDENYSETLWRPS